MSGITQLNNNISVFKRRLLQMLAFRSISFFVLSFTSVFLAATYLEYFLYLPVVIKTGIVLGGGALFSYLLFILVILPAKNFLNYNRFLSDENAAEKIGSFFPDIKDKLLNTVQLQAQMQDNSLASFSLSQRAEVFSSFNFTEAVEKEENKKLYLFALIPFILLTITYLYNSSFIAESSERLLDFNTAYQPPAPFQIRVLNPALKGFRPEPFDVNFEVTGEYATDQIYMVIDGVRKKVSSNNAGLYQFEIPKLTRETSFHIEMAGYDSPTYKISVLDRPSFSKGTITLHFPEYLNRKTEIAENLSNLNVPQGTEINWRIKTRYTEEVTFLLDSIEKPMTEQEDNVYGFSSRAMHSSSYGIRLQNQNATNKNKLFYHIEVAPDLYPEIETNVFEDTSLYSYIMINGNISDDYGFSALKLKYRFDDQAYKSISLPVVKKQPNQNYLYHWKLDSLLRNPDQKLEYFIEVWDNDGVNGPKSSRGRVLTFSLPDREEIKERIAEKSDNMQNQMEETLRQLKERDKELEQLEKSLKAKKSLSWQDKKAIEKEVQQQNALQQELEELNKQFKDLMKNQEKFDKKSESIREKQEALEKLMEELMDEETKKLMEELQKMMEETKPNEQALKNMLDQLKKEDFNLEKELERALELMKELKMQSKIEETRKELDKLAEEQNKLSEETTEKKESNEQLSEKQKDIESKFEEIKEDIKEIDKINNELNNKPDEFEKETSEDAGEISEDMQDAQEQLEKNQNSKSGKSQKSAAQKMQEMSNKMQKMAMEGEMEQNGEDLQALRQILENLITLSFDQENLMNDFKKIKSVNPQFVEKSTAQIKIKDDSKIVEDSLMALAKRNFQIKSFVTDELFEMNEKIENSLDAIRDREIKNITVNQQLAMTSMNNLALMLSDVAEQMQQQMAQQMAGDQQCSKPKNKPGGKKLSQMQQELNQQIQGLKKSGKQGKELSEELAKMAAQQEMIRQQLQEMEKGQNKPGDGKLEKMMEETEKDLVNKRLLNMSLARQEEIVTRLLKSEKAQRERDLDELREAEKAKQRENNAPAEFEEYLKEKEKQIELLKTISPAYSPYYKKEIKEYFENETK